MSTITITSLNHYQQLANRTNNYKHHTGANAREAKLVGALGLIGEAVEVLELFAVDHGMPLDLVKLKKELGDVSWYIATTLLYYGIAMEELDIQPSPIHGTLRSWSKELTFQAKNVSEMVKKEIGHHHVEDRRALLAAMTRVYTCWRSIAFLAELDVIDTLSANITKLATRYPEGFSAELSMNRAEGDV